MKSSIAILLRQPGRYGVLLGALFCGLFSPILVTAQAGRCHPENANQAYQKILRIGAQGKTQLAAYQLAELYRCIQREGHTVGLLDSMPTLYGERLEAVCSQACGLAIAALHRDTFDRLQELREPSLAQNQLIAFDKALQLYGAKSKDPEVAAVKGHLLTSMALLQRDHGFMDGARSTFLRALKVAPSDPSLLHAAASLEEKLGNYPQARTYLLELMEVAPDDQEARLRLALVEARLGKVSAAEARFQSLLSAPTSPWIRVMAHQELTRLLSQKGDGTQALQVLEQARRAFPEEQSLLLLETFLLRRDRAGAADGSALAGVGRLAELEETLELSPPSSRLEYNEWPQEEMVPLELALGEVLEKAWQDLERGLSLLQLRQETGS
ncbi:MAG: tetratricopeptide repeat protein [Deltaproteobacteria bacterium]|nr:tetratricopeptide repeat protein [Deltaproteobacteria bacterium]